MPITPLPTPPSRSDPTNFAQRGDDFLGALPTFATEANTLASEVTASEAAVNAIVNVALWVSGTSYTIGQAVFSPITYFTYRRKTNGAGTTDPSADSTNWALAVGTGDVRTTATQTLTNKTLDGGTIVTANSASDALRITQTGAGNALVVEDSANPDATPFVINASGNTIVGHTTAIAYGSFTPNLQSQMASQNAGFAAGNWQNTAGAPNIWLGKSRGGIGTHTIVQSNDGIGNIRFYGSDGVGFIEAASVYAFVDGTPGTNDMPGRLVFSTTLDGASTPTERFRISNFGGWGLAGANYGTSGTQAIVSNGNAAAPTWQTVVTPTATQNLSNKTLIDPVITGTITEDIFTITDGAAFEIDPANGSIQLITLGASRTPKATNFVNGETVTLMVDDGTDYTLTWTDATFGGTGVVWKTGGGTAPTLLTSGFTVIVLWKVSNQVYGARVGNA